MKALLRNVLFSLFLTLVGTELAAQQIAGQVKDQQGEGVPFAGVIAYAWPDSILTKATAADADGNYVLQLKDAGRYRLMVRAVGYPVQWSATLTMKAGESLTQSFTLKQAALESKEVEVVARKPIIRKESGKTIIDVENSTLNTGMTAIDVLRRMPGVTISGENSVSLRGQKGILIMIDGKRTFLTEAQLAALLRTTPSDQIKEIELITQPDARYDSEGTGGMINIVFKRNRLEGFSGEVHTSYGQGTYSRANGGLSLNAGWRGIKLFGSYDYTDRNWLMDITNDRRYPLRLADGSELREGQNLVSYYKTGSWSNRFRIGGEADIQNTNIRFESNGNISRELFEANSTSKFFNGQDQLQQRTQTADVNPDNFKNYELNLTVTQKLDTNGQKLTTDVVYGEFLQRSTQEFKFWFFDPAGNATGFRERYMTTSPTNKVMALKVDYELPIGKLFNLTAGGKYTSVYVTNANDFYDVTAEQRTLDPVATNAIDYREEIRAAYSQLSYKIGKWSAQLGLRGEHWITNGTFANSPLKIERNQFLLFPSGSLEYKVSDATTYSIAYSKRINRPGYGSLSPYSFYIDANTFYAGNPNLKPAITDNLEIGGQFLEGALGISISYVYGQDIIGGDLPFRRSDTSRTLYISPVNVPLHQNLALNVNASLPVTKWWNVDFFGMVYYNLFAGDILGGEFRNELVTPMGQLTNRISLPWGLEFEIMAMGHMRSVYFLQKTLPFGRVTLGLKKSFMDKKLNVRLAAHDIFRTDAYWGEIDSKWMTYRGFFRGDERVLGFAITYNFGQMRAPQRKERDSELDRMGGR